MTPIRRLGTAFSITVLVLAASRPVAARPAPARIGAAGQVPMSEARRRQIPLSQAAKVIRTEVEQGNNSGYAGIELTDNQVLVWWKGAMPAPVAQAVTRARSIAPVQVRAAAHSLRQLRAAGATIRAAWADVQPRSTYAVDGSRVSVGVPAVAHRLARPDVGVPVEVVDRGTKVPASRVDDWAPWIGGADQINGGARCTTGFPVEAEQIYGQTAVRLGDSGGPVYTHSAAGGVIAKGINSYTYNDYVLGFQDFGTAVMDYGIWIAS